MYDSLQTIASNKLAICPNNGSYVTKNIEKQKAFVESVVKESGDVNDSIETGNCILHDSKACSFKRDLWKAFLRSLNLRLILQTGAVPFKMIRLFRKIMSVWILTDYRGTVPQFKRESDQEKDSG